MECPLHLAPEHPLHSELPSPSDLCIWQPQRHAPASQEDHGLLQSNQTSLHRVRAHEGPTGMFHVLYNPVITPPPLRIGTILSRL